MNEAVKSERKLCLKIHPERTKTMSNVHAEEEEEEEAGGRRRRRRDITTATGLHGDQPEGSWVRTERERTAGVLREKINGVKAGVD